MILHLMKCEMCDATHRFNPMMGHVLSQMPHAWLSLHSGDRGEEGHLFCSVECLKKHLGVGESVQLLGQPASKMRRFILVDGETADETEGVKWSDGRVTLESRGCSLETWEGFKCANPGSGVTWIDQEIKEEEMSHAAN